MKFGASDPSRRRGCSVGVARNRLKMGEACLLAKLLCVAARRVVRRALRAKVTAIVIVDVVKRSWRPRETRCLDSPRRTFDGDDVNLDFVHALETRYSIHFTSLVSSHASLPSLSRGPRHLFIRLAPMECSCAMAVGRDDVSPSLSQIRDRGRRKHGTIPSAMP